MHTIKFKMTFRDWQEGRRVALSHMTPFYQTFWGFYPITCLLLLTGGLVMILWSQGYPATWPPTQLPPRSMLLHILHIGLGAGVGLAFPFSIVIVYIFLRPLCTVQISPKKFTFVYTLGVRRYTFGVNQILWKKVNAILDTGEHICFCTKFASAVVIPRSAFPNPAQANAFLEEARDYWRRETGQSDPPPMNAVGVWPPAPRGGNSAEVGNSTELDGKHSH